MKRCFGGIYAGRSVLVTGHTGFKGSWLCLWLSLLGAEVVGLALDPQTSPAHWTLLDLEGVVDHRCDLRDRDGLRRIFSDARPEIVFHLAAQALVRRSYEEPLETFETNVIGLLHLFEAAREASDLKAIVNVTTDKVYLDTQSATGSCEDDPLGGHDPYSTSKACAELISACYRGSYFGTDNGPRLATARAGNVIGGGDWSKDRLVPDLVRAAASGDTLRIRSPKAVRPWQHVLEPLSAYLRLGQGLLGYEAVEGAWNFGPSATDSLAVEELVAGLHQSWPSLQVELDPGPHPHEAVALRLSSEKAVRHLGWRPVWCADETIARTAQWYLDFYDQGRIRSRDDLEAYVLGARSAELEWAG